MNNPSSEQQVVDNFKNSELMESEMLALLLERFELSKGFNNLEKKTNRPHTSGSTLLPSKSVFKQLAFAKQQVLGQNADQPVIQSVLDNPPEKPKMSNKKSTKTSQRVNRLSSANKILKSSGSGTPLK